MAEITATILHLRPPSGKRVAVLAAGGGINVATGDICAEEGLDAPALSPKTRTGLREFISLVNQGVLNPLDVPGVIANITILPRTLALIAADPLIDIIVLHVSAEFFAGPLSGVMSEFNECILELNRKDPGGKPVVVAMCDEYRDERIEKYARELRKAGIVAYGSLRSACRALNRFASYYKFLDESDT